MFFLSLFSLLSAFPLPYRTDPEVEATSAVIPPSTGIPPSTIPPPGTRPDNPAGNPLSTYSGGGGKTSPDFSNANAEAIHWLNLADQQQWGGTWMESGALLKDLVTQDQWVGGMRATRSQLGMMRTRQVSSFQQVDHLPRAAMRGSFLIIKYATQFSNQANATEIITLMKEERLGIWKVIAYRIGS